MKLLDWIEGIDSVDASYCVQRAYIAFDMFYTYMVVLLANSSTKAKSDMYLKYCNSPLPDNDQVALGAILELFKHEKTLLCSLDRISKHEFNPSKDKIDISAAIDLVSIFHFYEALLKNKKFHSVDSKKMYAIDLALVKLAFEIGKQTALLACEGFDIDGDRQRIANTLETLQKSAKDWQKKAIGILECGSLTLERYKNKHYTIAEKVKLLWAQKYPEDTEIPPGKRRNKIPSKSTLGPFIKNYLRTKNLKM